MTSAPRRFLLDTSVFVQAHRTYYAFDICPGFWDALLALHEAGRWQSLDRVRSELEAGNDRLKTWATSQVPASGFAACDEPSVVASFARAAAWVESQPRFGVAAKEEFAHVADGWLPAYAHVHQLVVVTQEEARPDARKTVPLPNVCIALGVPYISTFAMLRESNVALSWARP